MHLAINFLSASTYVYLHASDFTTIASTRSGAGALLSNRVRGNRPRPIEGSQHVSLNGGAGGGGSGGGGHQAGSHFLSPLSALFFFFFFPWDEAHAVQ